MPELLQSTKLAIEKGQAAGRDESYLKQLADYIIPALIEPLHKVCNCALDIVIIFQFNFMGLLSLLELHFYSI